MDVSIDDLEFEFSLRPDSDPTLSHYVIGFRGKALLWDDREGKEKIVAELRGYRLDLATATMDGIEQNVLLDSVCPEISDFSETVFEESGASISIACLTAPYAPRSMTGWSGSTKWWWNPNTAVTISAPHCWPASAR
ncbi:hypothetical protein [Solemya velesiana gill symbiont]|uniref:hypothetical protein n=1 Tax=Solemya velesiana gill symbiont TaxID=1918948 RepID=UPI001FE2F739|nr:hypothetical protein [Solemya velesiana gill symbiont]